MKVKCDIYEVIYCYVVSHLSKSGTKIKTFRVSNEL